MTYLGIALISSLGILATVQGTVLGAAGNKIQQCFSLQIAHFTEATSKDISSVYKEHSLLRR